MADTDNFPLTGDNHDAGDDFDGTAAGASGVSTGGMVLSQGALIAIIVVVVVVALAGSKCTDIPANPFPRAPQLTILSRSCYVSPLLRRQEARVDREGDTAEVGKKGRHRPDTTAIRVPQVGQGRERAKQTGRRAADTEDQVRVSRSREGAGQAA